MKRSDLITIIRRAINSVSHSDLLFDDAQSEHVLDEIEAAGMLPPPDGVEAVTHTIVYAYYNERVEEDHEYNLIRSKLWEPEAGA